MPGEADRAIRGQLRRRRRWRRLRGLTLLLVLLGGLGWGMERWLAAHRVFTVEVIRLVACPDHLRGPAAQALNPLIGHSYFEAAAWTDAFTARLASLPEVAGAVVTCRPPNIVEVRLTPRVPALTVRAGPSWATIDAGGVVIRTGPRPEPGLVALLGARAVAARPGEKLLERAVGEALACARATERQFGQPPRMLAVEPGGGFRVRTATGHLVLLGQPRDLPRKLRRALLLVNRVGSEAAYVDVSNADHPAVRPLEEAGAATAKAPTTPKASG